MTLLLPILKGGSTFERTLVAAKRAPALPRSGPAAAEVVSIESVVAAAADTVAVKPVPASPYYGSEPVIGLAVVRWSDGTRTIEPVLNSQTGSSKRTEIAVEQSTPTRHVTSKTQLAAWVSAGVTNPDNPLYPVIEEGRSMIAYEDIPPVPVLP